jgi:hypothetical protein
MAGGPVFAFELWVPRPSLWEGREIFPSRPIAERRQLGRNLGMKRWKAWTRQKRKGSSSAMRN